MNTKLQTITLLICLIFILSGCDNVRKKAAEITSSTPTMPADSLNAYVSQYEKNVDALEALAAIVKEYGDLVDAEADFPMWQQQIADCKEWLNTYENQLTDEMLARVETTNKKNEAAMQIISLALGEVKTD